MIGCVQGLGAMGGAISANSMPSSQSCHTPETSLKVTKQPILVKKKNLLVDFFQKKSTFGFSCLSFQAITNNSSLVLEFHRKVRCAFANYFPVAAKEVQVSTNTRGKVIPRQDNAFKHWESMCEATQTKEESIKLKMTSNIAA